MRIRLKKKRKVGSKDCLATNYYNKYGEILQFTRLIYLAITLYIGMQMCGTCGLLLESVDDSQVEKGGRFSNPEYFCEKHKPLIFIEA
jgi:hypothetical protein